MKKKHTYIDIFAGCGGLSEGFNNQDFKALTHVDNDHDSCETIKTRMKFHGYMDKDISVLEKDMTNKNIIKLIANELNGSKIDVLLGGPPCQSFSSLGRAKDKDSMRNDTRNYLFENYKKILDHFKPKIFVFENVTGLLTAKIGNKKTIDIIFKRLGGNYNLIDDYEKLVLNSCNYGVPQIRKRVFIIGIRKDIALDIKKIYQSIKKTHFNPKTPKKNRPNRNKYITVKEAISGLPKLLPGQGMEISNFKQKKINQYLNKIRLKTDDKLFNHVSRTHNNIDRQRFREMSKNKWSFEELLKKKPLLSHKKKRVFNNSYVVQEWDKPARTIISHLHKDGNQFIHPDYKQERSLTAREAARIQSFPDSYFFAGSRTQQYKQIGNAVPPLMAEAIAKSIKKALDKI
ncbi:DNA cytosine methyltransferase [Pelagibacterales bacterium]|nr:DNA cytosine methyltransferase [Pelagibacterales bacterium]